MEGGGPSWARAARRIGLEFVFALFLFGVVAVANATLFQPQTPIDQVMAAILSTFALWRLTMVLIDALVRPDVETIRLLRSIRPPRRGFTR